MLVGVSLGPGDPKLVTLKAVEILKEADKVYVPGELAYKIAKNFCNPEIIEIPMGKGRDYAEKIANKLAKESKDKLIAFAVLGDIHFFSTFMHIKRIIKEKYPNIDVKTVPGVASFVAVFSLINRCVNKPFKVVTQENFDDEILIVLKAKKPKEITEKMKKLGYNEIIFIEKAFMDEEKILKNKIPEKSSYWTILIGYR